MEKNCTGNAKKDLKVVNCQKLLLFTVSLSVIHVLHVSQSSKKKTISMKRLVDYFAVVGYDFEKESKLLIYSFIIYIYYSIIIFIQIK